MALIWALVATTIVSLASFAGIITMALNEKVVKRLLILMVGFSAGSMIGAALFHLIPESLEKSSTDSVFMFVAFGFVFFFIMERYFYWRHCHTVECSVHVFKYLNLLGDGIHNFIDGMVIAVAFVTSFELGVITTVVILAHEIPQELGDYGVLIYGGFSKSKALLYNFLIALTAVVGAVSGYLLSGLVNNISAFLLPFTSGGFIYIAATDLVPELHKEKNSRKANLSLVVFILGLVFMFLMKIEPAIK